ncbi:MAG: type II toxin-antitoxin system death-on-curing family toxin [Hyphomonadaceae bacterium]|nr:type II toxin-antitoxin system death-on-curing family toxin [Hyphomonadaceae bacterium]
MNRPIWVDRSAVLQLHAESLVLHGGAVGIRDIGLLESALARPQNLHAYNPDADAAALAAAYAFGIIRNHPFVDGNKRTGFLAAAMFVEANGLRFVASEAEVITRTLALASSEIDEAEFATWLRGNVGLL